MVGKLIALVVLCVGVGIAQRSDTVYITLATAETTTGTAHAITTNIGQSSHLAYITLAQVPAQSCGQAITNAYFQFSFDNSTWTNFGAPPNTTSLATPATIVAQGAFPFVRLVVNFNNVTCTMSAFYVGTVQAQSVLVSGVAPYHSSVVDSNSNVKINPMLVGGIGYNNLLAPLAVCDRTAAAVVASGTSVFLFTPVGLNAYICSIAVTSAGTGTFTLAWALVGTGNCQGASKLFGTWVPTFNVISSAPLTIGTGVGVIAKGLASDTAGTQQVCGVATGADMQVLISYSTGASLQ